MKTESILKKLATLAMLGAFVLCTSAVVGCEESSDVGDTMEDAATEAEAAAGEAAEAAEGAADDAASAIEDATN